MNLEAKSDVGPVRRAPASCNLHLSVVMRKVKQAKQIHVNVPLLPEKVLFHHAAYKNILTCCLEVKTVLSMNVSTLEKYSATVPMQLITCCRFDALLRLKAKQHVNVTVSTLVDCHC